MDSITNQKAKVHSTKKGKFNLNIKLSQAFLYILNNIHSIYQEATLCKKNYFSQLNIKKRISLSVHAYYIRMIKLKLNMLICKRIKKNCGTFLIKHKSFKSFKLFK